MEAALPSEYFLDALCMILEAPIVPKTRSIELMLYHK
jgi:hypothetical protein